MAISDRDYNNARAVLVRAGSRTAEASHDRHTRGAGSPDEYGKSLLREARDEFRKMDRGQAGLVSEMSRAHYDAVHTAADTMGLDRW